MIPTHSSLLHGQYMKVGDVIQAIAYLPKHLLYHNKLQYICSNFWCEFGPSLLLEVNVHLGVGNVRAFSTCSVKLLAPTLVR